MGPVSTEGISQSLPSLTATGLFSVAHLAHSSPASASLIQASNTLPSSLQKTPPGSPTRISLSYGALK